jgi:Zn-dependent protease with chaperone function
MSTPLLEVLPFALLGGMLFAFLLALALAAVERPLLARLAALAPRQRERLLFALLLAPLVAGISHAALTVASAILARDSGLLAAVCADHGGSLWHACVWHPPSDANAPIAWLLLAVTSAVLLRLGARMVSSLRHSRRAVASLLRLSRPEHGARILDSDHPLVLTAGLEGHVLLSRALLQQLDAQQLRIVLAHELAHVAQRDVLRRWLAGGLSRLHLPGTRRRLRAAFDLAVEQRCDRVAADAVGDPLAVAETIITVERLIAGHAAGRDPLAAYFAHGMVDQRVAALLAAPCRRTRGLGAQLLAAMIGLGLAANGALHHLSEFLLTGVFA